MQCLTALQLALDSCSTAAWLPRLATCVNRWASWAAASNEDATTDLEAALAVLGEQGLSVRSEIWSRATFKQPSSSGTRLLCRARVSSGTCASHISGIWLPAGVIDAFAAACVRAIAAAATEAQPHGLLVAASAFAALMLSTAQLETVLRLPWRCMQVLILVMLDGTAAACPAMHC